MKFVHVLCRGLQRLLFPSGWGSLLTPGVNAGATCLPKHIAARFRLNALTYQWGFNHKSTDNCSSGKQEGGCNSQPARLALYYNFGINSFFERKTRKISHTYNSALNSSIINHSVFCAVRSEWNLEYTACFFSFPLSLSKCWDGSEVPSCHCMLLMQASRFKFIKIYPLTVEATKLLT
jgi:hypothetical protein